MKKKLELKTKQKKKFLEDGLKEDHVLLHLDARVPGVEVPPHLADNPSLTLKLSYLFQGKTEINQDNVTAYLRFSGEYYKCQVPWNAIWGITSSSQQNQIWPEDLPKEVVLQLARSKITELGQKLFGRRSKSDETQQEISVDEAKEQQEPKNPPGTRKAHLTRIK